MIEGLVEVGRVVDVGWKVWRCEAKGGFCGGVRGFEDGWACCWEDEGKVGVGD